MLIRRVLAGVALFAFVAASPATLVYPPTPVHPVVDRYFGHAVTDPYRWLESGTAPAVKAWAAKQRTLATSYLHAQPRWTTYAKRVTTLLGTSTTRYALQIAGGRDIYLRQTPPQAQAELIARDGLDGPERVLFDPQRAAGAGAASPSIESVYPSFDGRRVAFTTQEGGAEVETLHVVDASTGTLESDTVANVGGGTSPVAVLWDGDGKGFLHTEWPLKSDGTPTLSNIEIWHHVLGTDSSADTYVFGRGLLARAEYVLLGSADGKYQALFVTDGDGVHGSFYERPANGTFVRVATPADAIGSSGDAAAAFIGDRLAVISAKRAPTGEVVAIAPGGTFASGTVLVKASPLAIENIVAAAKGFLVVSVDGGDSAVRYVGTAGKPATVPIPPISRVTEAAADVNGSEIIIGDTSYTAPNTWLRYNPKTNSIAKTGIGNVAHGDFSHVIVRRELVPSLDGRAKVPVEITSLPGVRTDGTAPTLLTAYGAYGLITRPGFLGPLLAFLERGGVVGKVMIRGGGEYGETWHTQAKLATKTKSSDDLAAVAAWMGAHGYGNARHLGILGGSAGGYLMGLALTRNPERYRAVLSEVGFYDLLRSERTPNGAYNTPEFGTVKDPAQFAWMRKQSPYENVRRGVSYPAVLMTTGENDPRVDPYDSRKMIARLQAASTSGLPILLWQKAGQGHGIFNSFQQRVEELTTTLTWFESQLR